MGGATTTTSVGDVSLRGEGRAECNFSLIVPFGVRARVTTPVHPPANPLPGAGPAEVDPALIGGAIVRAGDLVIDGSLSTRLERIAYELTA